MVKNVKIIKLPDMKGGTCRCRVVSVGPSRKVISNEDCTCDFKPLKGRIRSIKLKNMNLWEMKESWDIRMGPDYYEELGMTYEEELEKLRTE